jgi:hypothetical protein
VSSVHDAIHCCLEELPRAQADRQTGMDGPGEFS